eukprot:m.1267152 g.1267152  ORF g.1267152 m.1267152 type:complete len:128 (+) comp24742_c0_seq8:4039-4422(+)
MWPCSRLRPSIPIYKLCTRMHPQVEEMKVRVHGLARVCTGYGHVGDGNLHLNIVASAPSDEILAAIEPFVYEYTSSRRGSVSAEHGLGVMKAKKIHYSRSPPEVQLMQTLKATMDPNCILNPYKTVI